MARQGRRSHRIATVRHRRDNATVTDKDKKDYYWSSLSRVPLQEHRLVHVVARRMTDADDAVAVARATLI